MSDILLIGGICLLAGTLQAVIGFGFGLVAIALLAFFFDIKEASILLVIAGLSLSCYIFFRLRSHFKLDRMQFFIAAAIVGVPLGVFFLISADPVFLKRILGGLLVLSGIQRLIPYLAKHRWHPTFAGLACGLFTGALSGAFGTGGPPAVVFVASQQFDKYRWMATLQVVFALTAVMRLITLSGSGVLNQHQLLLSAWGGLCAVIGGRWGLHILTYFSADHLKWLVTIMLFILGMQFLLFSNG
jgi:uncharacterized membrane protein YfcA